MWEVDLQSRIFTLYHYSKSPQVTAPPQGKFPDFLIENGWIHPGSVKLFREFARELLEGRIQGYGNFNHPVSGYRLLQLGIPVIPAGWRTMPAPPGRWALLKNRPRQCGAQETILTEHALPDALTPYLVGRSMET